MNDQSEKRINSLVGAKLKFKYKFPEDYNPTYVNGAFGGITPSGEIVVNFYLERHAVPRSQTMEVTADGVLGSEVAKDPADLPQSMVRYVGPGIVLSPHTAKAIHTFLSQQLEALESIPTDLPNPTANEDSNG